MKKLVPLLAALLLFLRPALCAEEEIFFQSGPSQNTLVQLFVSDSSAASNPAMEWVNAQKDKDPRNELWALFVPVALHVHHWDPIGYKDAFAKKEFENMLLAYRRSWNTENVYAPTVVANGVEWSGWSRGQPVPSDRDKQPGLLIVRASLKDSGKGKFLVEFKPSKTLENEALTLHTCLVGFDVESKPAEGRNRGKSLRHDFIATAYRATDFTRGRTSIGAAVEIPLPRNRTSEEGRCGMVFWVTKKDGLLPLQATGGFLPQT